MLESWKESGDALLYYIAGIYNSELAQRFIDQTIARQIQVRIPEQSQKSTVVNLIQHARRLQWLHLALYDFAGKSTLREEDLPAQISLSLWARLGLRKETSPAKGYRAFYYYTASPDFPDRLAEAIADEQEELDALVYLLYDLRDDGGITAVASP